MYRRRYRITPSQWIVAGVWKLKARSTRLGIFCLVLTTCALASLSFFPHPTFVHRPLWLSATLRLQCGQTGVSICTSCLIIGFCYRKYKYRMLLYSILPSLLYTFTPNVKVFATISSVHTISNFVHFIIYYYFSFKR